MELRSHPRYSPDLGLNDLFTFRKIKKKLRGHPFLKPEDNQYKFNVTKVTKVKIGSAV